MPKPLNPSREYSGQLPAAAVNRGTTPAQAQTGPPKTAHANKPAPNNPLAARSAAPMFLQKAMITLLSFPSARPRAFALYIGRAPRFFSDLGYRPEDFPTKGVSF